MDIPERVVERFWARVGGDPARCWPWPLSVGSHGYGQVGWQVGENRTMMLAHRFAWMTRVGPIPDGLTIDHRCRNRRCVNVSHLRLRTMSENASDNGFATRTHCPRGHRYAGANLGGRPGDRRCRLCAKYCALKRRSTLCTGFDDGCNACRSKRRRGAA